MLYDRIARLDPGATATARDRTADAEGTEGTRTRSSRRASAPWRSSWPTSRRTRSSASRSATSPGPMALLRRYPDDQGVLITGIRPGFPAEDARPRLREGDVLRELNGKPVVDAAAFAAILADLGTAKKVAVRVRREAEDVLTVVDVEKKEQPKRGGELAKPWLGVLTQVLTPDVAEALGLGGDSRLPHHAGLRGHRGAQGGPPGRRPRHDARRQAAEGLPPPGRGAAHPPHRAHDHRRVRRLRRAARRVRDDDRSRPRGDAAHRERGEERQGRAARDQGARHLVRRPRREAVGPGAAGRRRRRGDQRRVGESRRTPRRRPAALHGRQRDARRRDLRAGPAHVGERRPALIVLFVRRGYRTKFLFVEPEYPENQAAGRAPAEEKSR